ncbi:MAG: hypothetical protein U9O86_09530 [Campylobacterota bacterium]|nr:hypothetical protein [Campylobacterota bacterium]
MADSSLKAAKQQDSLVAEMQQQIKADNPKVSDDDAKKIAEGFVKGGEEASKSITEAMNKGIDINAASAAVASAGALAGTMMGGKTAADIVSVDRADEKYKNGGYVGLQKDSAQIKTDSSIGDTSGLLDVPESHRESYIKGALQKADLTSAEKGKDVRDDFKRAGLINDDDSVNADNWVSGTGYLRANNMSSHNALVAGGMVFSGALGDDSTVKADGEESLKTGSSTTNNMDTAQKVSAFNAMQKATGGEEITYDENTGQLNIPDEKTGREFLSHVGKTDLVQKTGQNAVAETLGAVAETLGLSAETVVYGIGGAAVTGGAIGLGKKLSLGKKAKVHSTKDKRGDTDSDNIDTKHNPTPSEIKSQSETNLKAGRASYSEYSEERKNLQADANKESAKISDMQEKRVGLVADGKPTASIDHEISESQKRLDSTNGEIDSKTRQMDAQNTVNNLEKEKIAKIDESVKPLSLHLS